MDTRSLSNGGLAYVAKYARDINMTEAGFCHMSCCSGGGWGSGETCNPKSL